MYNPEILWQVDHALARMWTKRGNQTATISQVGWRGGREGQFIALIVDASGVLFERKGDDFFFLLAFVEAKLLEVKTE